MPEDALEERIRLLEETVARDTATAFYLPLAERYREQGRIEEAIRLCEQRKNRPGRGVGDRIVLGRCYLAGGRLPDARAEFETALSLDRENVVALKALAGILAHEGAHSRAADLYRAVCRVDPGDLESQSALHQITSGEFPEVRPPDVVVDAADVAWQPVRLPREEEHLSDLALGLRTIESFDVEPPKQHKAPVMDFQELAIETLGREMSRATVEPPPTVEALPPLEAPPPALKPPPEPPTPVEPPPTSPTEDLEEPAAAKPEAQVIDFAAVRGEPERPGEASRPKVLSGNKSAFEEWLGRLGGRR
jgi:tetratricopeptide (TPR) repeat protein